MIQVAICDDEYETLHFLDDAVTQYGIQRNIPFAIDKFSQAEQLKTNILRNNIYQIYILDMLMPQINGIEIGQIIRRQDKHSAIIYLTSSADFAYQAFGVFAQRYLLKPVSEADFHEAMDFAVMNALQIQKALHIKTANGIQRILYRDIEYIENAARALHIYTTDRKEIISRLLRNSFESDMDELLNDMDFIQAHKSFIVNLNHVMLYDTRQITMSCGRQIPISKNRQAAVKRAYLKFIAENY